MDVEVIYCRPGGSQTPLGTRQMSHMPPTGEPFQLDDRIFVAKSYAGPDSDGRYHLFVEDEPAAARH